MENLQPSGSGGVEHRDGVERPRRLQTEAHLAEARRTAEAFFTAAPAHDTRRKFEFSSLIHPNGAVELHLRMSEGPDFRTYLVQVLTHALATINRLVEGTLAVCEWVAGRIRAYNTKPPETS